MTTLLAAVLLAPYAGEFSLHQAIDPSTHKVAFRYLLPKGWTAKDDIHWELAKKFRALNASSVLTSEDGTTSISVLPTELMTFQVQNGNLSGTLPPETATKALDNVLAASHPGLTNATLVVRKDFDVPTPLDNQGLKTKGMVGVLEVSFQQNGQQMTELLSTTEYEGSHQGDGGQVQGVWMMFSGFTLSCRGPISESAYRTFAVVAASHREDPTFFAIVKEVNSRQQSGTVDLQGVVASVKGLDGEAKTGYVQNLTFRGQSIAKMFPIYPGETEVDTYEGSLMSFKGLHTWMKKPNDYAVSDSDQPPGPGWEPAKESG